MYKVHWNTLVPRLNPVTADVGEFGVVNVPVPLTSVHSPVAGGVGALPVKFVDVAHNCWLAPALAFGLF